MKVTIDKYAGFCYGVERAIQAAEQYLESNNTLYCLGDIVHNEMELQRLRKMGLVVIDREKYKKLEDVTVLLRAHGEPPETYDIAEKNRIELIDATCPLVLKLQKKIRLSANENKPDGQIIVYGKPTHPEIIGLKGQANDKIIVVNDLSDLDQVDFSKPIRLYSQTTRDKRRLLGLKTEIQRRIDIVSGPSLQFNDTICKQVHNRNDSLKEFCEHHQVILFVGGKKSSNAKVLFHICKSTNPSTYFLSNADDLQPGMLKDVEDIGISGATSTPRWLLDSVKEKILSW